MTSHQACISAALRCVEDLGGTLRQFILDDKGVVIIWTCAPSPPGPAP